MDVNSNLQKLSFSFVAGVRVDEFLAFLVMEEQLALWYELLQDTGGEG